MNNKIFLFIFGIIFLIGFTSAALTDGLIAYYPLNETTGTNAQDVVFGNNLTTFNMENTDWVTGKLANALKFDRVNESANKTTSFSELNISADYSISFWVNSSAVIDLYGVIGNYIGANDRLGIGIENSRMVIRSYGGVASDNFISSTNAMSTNTWYHFVAIHFGTNNSVVLFQDTVVQAGTENAFTPSSAGFRIGAIDTPVNDGLNGTLDEIGIWNRTLTSAEITDLYNLGAGITYPFVVFPIIVLSSPVDNYNTTSTIVNFTAEATEKTNPISTVKLIVDDVYIDTNSSGLNGTYTFLETLTVGSHNWTMEVCDTSSNCFNSSERTVNIYNHIINSVTYNPFSYETKSELFYTNITTNGSTITSGKFIYNGTSYNGVTVTSLGGNDYNLSKSITIPLNSGNNSFYFNITFAGIENNLTSYQQNVSSTVLALCNGTYTTRYINVTFKNETTDMESVTSTLTSSWIYSLTSLSGIYKTLTYSNTTENLNYSFCLYPSTESVNVQANLSYSNSVSPQRVYSLSSVLTNTTTTLTLYLLPSSLGLYTYFSVQDYLGNSLSNVAAVISRTIGTTPVTISSSMTDSSGLVVFFLNPDFTYSALFSKTGYQDNSFSFVPVSDTRTVTMASVTTQAGNGSQIALGTTYLISPENSTLNNNTEIVFTFNVTSNQTIDYMSMNLTNSTSQLNFTSQASQGNLTIILNTGNNTRIYGIFNITSGNETITITRIWNVGQEFLGDYSFYKQMTLYTTYGFNTAIQYLIVIFIIMIVIGLMSKAEVIDTSESKIVAGILIIWIFSFVGWLDTGLVVTSSNAQINILTQFANKFGIAIISTAGGVFFIFRRLF